VPGAAVGTRSRSIVTLRQMTQGDASRANKINGDKGDVASNDASPNFPGERAAKQFDRAQHRSALPECPLRGANRKTFARSEAAASLQLQLHDNKKL
jgi:hypothetical protein